MKEQIKRLIINADDFGFSEDTVVATIELFNKGLLTSATMMPNMPTEILFNNSDCITSPLLELNVFRDYRFMLKIDKTT